jgi:hypothetical protein
MDAGPAGMGSPSACTEVTTVVCRSRSAPGRLPVVSAASLGLLAVNLNSPGYYIRWGFIQISLSNLIVILLMFVVFVVALFAPFPGGRNRP